MEADFIYVNKDKSRSLVSEKIPGIPNVGDGKRNPQDPQRGYKIVGIVWGVTGITIWAVEQ